MKYNQQTQEKIERIYSELDYIIRYERGNFQSGYCILEHKKVVVLNKFLQLEGRINTLIDILPQIEVDTERLSPASLKLYQELMAGIEAKEKKGGNPNPEINN
jgi:hypothetical protein